MKEKRNHWLWIALGLVALSWGCVAAIPVREKVKVDNRLPVGKVEGNQFTGIRYPFKVSAPPGWKISTEYPKFMVDLGYEKYGLEESEVFVYNPETQSNLQIDFLAVDRYSTFDQKKIEWLTTAVAGTLEELEDEVKKEYGKEVKIEMAPTEPVVLKGVPYAAKKYVSLALEGTKRRQGWVYGFAEPYQIFILYIILDRKEGEDLHGLKAILDSFEYLPPTKK